MPFPSDEGTWQPAADDPRVPGPFETIYAPPPRPKFQNRLWLHIALFVLTFASTTTIGALHYYFFAAAAAGVDAPFPVQHLVEPSFLAYGLWYSVPLLAILGAHEMGHYVFCRRYNIDASLPYFLPAPFVLLTGTLGAVIKIREPFPTRNALFDVGVAGPIAGFVVMLPIAWWGLSMSVWVPRDETGGFALGAPLLFQWISNWFFPVPQANQTLSVHPMAFAAWFGMLATALNLLPFGQLDGGHITYAALKRWSTPISMATVLTAVVMTWFTTSWMFLTVMMLLMLFLLGPRHPRVIYEWEPLSRGRYIVAGLALLILVVCFTPVPLEIISQR